MPQGERPASPVVEFLELLWDLAVLNVLFLLCSLPVVTAGGALAGLCYGAEKLRRQEGKPGANFFKGFRRNFRQASIAWLAALALLAFLFLDLYLLIQNGAGGMYYLLLGLVFLWLMFTLVYLYPLMVRFENSLLRHVRNAFVLSLTHLWQSVCLTVLALAPLLLGLISARLLLYTAVFWLALGFAAAAYGAAVLLRGVWPRSGDGD
ncbi:MAG: YesL family protein [Oscillospiraceae bacterium]|nr:YesL family protein [Oscillospiraceae bacterium]